MVIALVLIFIAIYAAIALEHPFQVSKSATALFGAGLLWTLYALSIGDQVRLGHELDETVTATARITFFLLGAMTIVEMIDAHLWASSLGWASCGLPAKKCTRANRRRHATG